MKIRVTKRVIQPSQSETLARNESQKRAYQIKA